MNIYKEIEKLLEEKIGYEQFNPGLSALTIASKKWNLIDLTSKIVTIAGTNGKGETTRALGHLISKNYTYMQWTSPHIQNITERFVINGKEVDPAELLSLIKEYLILHEKLIDKLSYYEFLFIIFLRLVKKYQPDFLLLEVGLGGRLDAVNILDADLVLLTSISRDHQEFLGNSFKKILFEKLGVLRKGSFLISSLELSYLRNLTKSFCYQKEVDFLDLFYEQNNLKNSNYSMRNKLLATMAYEKLINKRPLDEYWEDYQTSTMQSWQLNGINFLGFGSHNPDGIRKLVQFLSQPNYNKFDTLIFSFSKRSIKDLECMFKILIHSGISNLMIVGFNHPKAMDKNVLKTMAAAYDKVEFVDDIQKCITKISHKNHVIVCGSYYFLGEFRSFKCR